MDDFVSVRPNMFFTDGVSFERLLAIRANKRSRITVAGFMPIESTSCSKKAAAVQTLEIWSVIPLVRKLMRFQYPLRNKIPGKFQNKFSKRFIMLA